jgi:hypothetical protein
MYSRLVRFSGLLLFTLCYACGGEDSGTPNEPASDVVEASDTAPSADVTLNEDPGPAPLDNVGLPLDEGSEPSDPGPPAPDESPAPNDTATPIADTAVPNQDPGGPPEEDTQQTIPPPDPADQADCQDYTLCEAACNDASCAQQCIVDSPVGKEMSDALSACLIEVCGSPNSFSFSSCAKQAKWDECLLEYAACYQGTAGCLTIRDCTLACTEWQCQNLCIWSGALTSQYIFTNLMSCIGNNCNQACGTGNAAMCDNCVTQYCGVLRDQCMNDANN